MDANYWIVFFSLECPLYEIIVCFSIFCYVLLCFLYPSLCSVWSANWWRVFVECERALNKLQICVRQIKSWMSQNKLKLNLEKTEFFIAASSRFISNLSGVKLTLDDVTINPTVTLRNLGIVFDPVLNMSGQISSVVKCVHFHLRNLSRIRRFIDQDTCKLAVQALVFSRIDYGNALLLGATDFDLTRLQRLQNRAARLIFLVGRDTHYVLSCMTRVMHDSNNGALDI